jgi:hypothetical protein
MIDFAIHARDRSSAPRLDHGGVTELAIRCRAPDPESAVRFEQWLGQKCTSSPILMTDGTVRVSRLAPALVTVRASAGWLLEFELCQEESLLDWQCLAAMVTDLRLLGLEPTILTPPGLRSWPPRRVEGQP